MSKIEVKKTPYIKYIILSSIFMLIGIFLIYQSLESKEKIVINYQVDKNIDYQVFLKPNNFFEQPFLSKGTTYISSLINYINVDFKYNFEYDTVMDSEYTYYIKATILADKASKEEGNYWQKEFILQEKQTNILNNNNTINFNSNLKIDYQKYNDLLTSFKQEYGLSIDGKLKVELVIDINSTNKIIKNPIITKDTLELIIPLTQQTVDIRINTNEDNMVNNYVETIKQNEKNNQLFRITGISSFVITLLLFIKLIYLKIRDIKLESQYSKTLKKILVTYDAIIVSTTKDIDTKKYNVIEVNSFNELLDAHSEVRMPINYIEKKDCSKFLLIKENTAWVYTLKKR